MAQIVQKNFSAGEVSPDIEVRSDFVSNQTGLRTCRNAYIRRQGGFSRRLGTKFTTEINNQSELKARLIPFQFTIGDSVVIEMGPKYFRFIKNGALITKEDFDIPSFALGVIETSAAHTYVIGDELFLTMFFSDGSAFIKEKFVVSSVPDSTHVGVSTSYLGAVDFSVYGTLVGTGEIHTAIEVAHPFEESELFDVRFSQIGDLMTMVHFNHGVFNLTRFANDNWAFEQNSLQGNKLIPTDLIVEKLDVTNTGSYSYEFLASTVDSQGYESFPVYQKIISVKQHDGIDATRNLALNIVYTVGSNVDFIRIYIREVPYPLSTGAVADTYKGFGLYDVIKFAGSNFTGYTYRGDFTPDESQIPLSPTIIYGEVLGGSYPPIVWQENTVELAEWKSLAYGNGVFVAVATAALPGPTNRRVMTSPDGINWTIRIAASPSLWQSVCFANGLFVAVSSSGSTRVMTSPDGITWTSRTASQNNSWRSVCFGAGLFVAVSSDGTNRVMTSPDGITWTNQVASVVTTWQSVCFGNGLFIAVADTGTSAMRSVNGITWTTDVVINGGWKSVTFGNREFLACGTTGTSRLMRRGESPSDPWQALFGYSTSEWSSVAYDTNSGRYMVMSSTGAAISMSAFSTSPVFLSLKWQALTVPVGSWQSVIFADGKFVAVANTGANRAVIFDTAVSYGLETLHPTAVATSKERTWFGGPLKDPGRAYGSRVGFYNDFKKRDDTATVASDPVQANTPSENVGRILHLLDYKRLFAFTDNSEIVFKGSTEGGAISATDLPNPEKVSENGISKMRPLIVDKSVLYVQARGSIVRDMMAEITLDSYPGDEISLFSTHLVDNFELIDWAFQKTPHPIVWIVRNDGVMLSITYNATQQIKGWARHDFIDGEVESVACVAEAREDVLYVVVKRTINGFTKRYIETLVTQEPQGLINKTFLDSYLSFDGRNFNQAQTMTISTSTNYNYGSPLTLTSFSSYFNANHVGKFIFVYYGTEFIKLRIDVIVSPTVATVSANKDIPLSLRAIATTIWAYAVQRVSGLAHLEGKAVCVFADGNVYASPLNQEYATLTVTDSVLELDIPAAVIHVGLPFATDLQPLNFDTAERLNSMADKAIITNRFNAQVLDTSSFFAGTIEPIGDDYLEGLSEVKIREDEDYDEPNELVTGLAEVAIEGSYRIGGRVFVRQVDPLPLTILSILPDTQTN